MIIKSGIVWPKCLNEPSKVQRINTSYNLIKANAYEWHLWWKSNLENFMKSTNLTKNYQSSTFSYTSKNSLAKVSSSYLWQLLTFSFGVSSNFSQQKSPTAKIIGLYFLGTIVPRKYMPTISAVGLFCCNKFEETPNEKLSNCQR